MAVENPIERSRQISREQQELQRSTRELFHNAIDLLKK